MIAVGLTITAEEGVLKNLTCKIYEVSVQYEKHLGNRRTQDWFCETEIFKKGSLQNLTLPLEGLPEDFVTSNLIALQSGEAEIELSEVFRHIRPSYLSIQPNTQIIFRNQEQMSRLQQNRFDKTMGRKRLLIGRITAPGLAYTFNGLTAESMKGSLFGPQTGSMASQIKACSYDQLIFEPFPINTGQDNENILFIEFDIPLWGQDVATVFDLARSYVELTVANLTQVDHVAFFVPFGTFYGQFINFFWTSIAFFNGRMSIYNGRSGLWLSNLMHEIGHNMGLHHSAEGDCEKGDLTGYMGDTFRAQDGPLMCYNGAHSWKLGWYREKHLTLGPTDAGVAWYGFLYGVDDYETNAELSVVIIRILTEQEDDYYIMYNTKKGINKDVKEYGERVMVYKSDGKQSRIASVLRRNEDYRINNYFGSSDVVVRICLKNKIYAPAIIFLDASPSGEWYDSRGTTFNCEWYSIDDRCIVHGNDYSNFGMVAMEVCCYCMEQFSIFSQAPITTPSSGPTNTYRPSSEPTISSAPTSTFSPSSKPSTSTKPSQNPSFAPSPRPTVISSVKPSKSFMPTSAPTISSAPSSTFRPSSKPTSTSKPSSKPSQKPSSKPSQKPSSKPSQKPSSRPSSKPTSQSSTQPSRKPSSKPSIEPTQ